jgi:hypothetical protein
VVVADQHADFSGSTEDRARPLENVIALMESIAFVEVTRRHDYARHTRRDQT